MQSVLPGLKWHDGAKRCCGQIHPVQILPLPLPGCITEASELACLSLTPLPHNEGVTVSIQ